MSGTIGVLTWAACFDCIKYVGVTGCTAGDIELVQSSGFVECSEYEAVQP